MKKILLIEDDAPLCWLLGKILRTRYEVVMINKGMEAWSWLSEGNIPDLIIFGVNEESEESIEFLEDLSQNGLYRDIPVIVLSGVPDPALQQHCLELGAFSYITKPFDPQSFLSEVQSGLLHRSEVALIEH